MAATFTCTFVLCVISVIIAAKDLEELPNLEIILEDRPGICEVYARAGDTVNVHYTGLLSDGRMFDTSMQDGRAPFKFQLGTGSVITGWERGIHGMCPGEKRKLIIPPHLGYGRSGIEGVIPPDATLVFRIHLTGLERPSMLENVDKFLMFSIWPLGILSTLYYLYRKINTAEKEERKQDKKLGKKKR